MGGFCILCKRSGSSSEYEVLLQRRGGGLKNPYFWCLPGGTTERAERTVLGALERKSPQETAHVREDLRCAVARRVAFREIIEETGGGQGCPVLRNLKIPCMSMSWEFPELKQIDFSNEKIILPPRFSQEFLVNPNVSREIRSSSTSYFVYVLEGRYILYLYVIMNITTYEKE